MAQLRQDYPRFRAAGTVIVVVGPEDPDAFAAYWAQNELPFIGLPDPTHSVLKLYGQEIHLFKSGTHAGAGAGGQGRHRPLCSLRPQHVGHP